MSCLFQVESGVNTANSTQNQISQISQVPQLSAKDSYGCEAFLCFAGGLHEPACQKTILQVKRDLIRGRGFPHCPSVARAFSCYNTGNFTKGFNNGYVTKATNNLDNLIAKATNSDQYLTQTTHTVKNAHRNAVEPQKTDLGIKKLPPKAQNANMSVSVRSDSHLNNQPQIPENIQAENVPVRVHNSWDIFGDF